MFHFLEHHVFLDDAAEILGIPKLGVLEWVNSGHLRPVSGPGADSLPDYLFRRADIEQLRPELG